MATRKRVRAFNNTPRRAPDGSAFIKCDECGVSVAVALMDMHDCKVKKDVKKFKGNLKPSIPKKVSDDEQPRSPFKGDLKPLISENVSDDEQPRSPFMFFMESYSKSCEGKTLVEINREACEIWKKMPAKEQWPYILQAQKVDKAYSKLLHKEEIRLSQEEDDEVDSGKVTKGPNQMMYYYYGDDYSDSEG